VTTENQMTIDERLKCLRKMKTCYVKANRQERDRLASRNQRASKTEWSISASLPRRPYAPTWRSAATQALTTSLSIATSR
jgi:hypothetical protein